MPTMDDFFDSKYIKAADLKGREVSVIIAGVQPIKMNDGQKKAALLFEGKSKSLLLNKTNASKIAAAYGEVMDLWMGKPLLIYPDQTTFQGSMVDCIRVRVPAAPKLEPGDDGPGPGRIRDEWD